MEDEQERQCIQHFQTLPEMNSCICFYRKSNSDSYIIPGESSEYLINSHICKSASLKYMDLVSTNISQQASHKIPFITLSATEAHNIWSDLLLSYMQEIQVWVPQSRRLVLLGKATPGNVLQLDVLLQTSTDDSYSALLEDKESKFDSLTSDAWKSPPLMAAISIRENGQGQSVQLAIGFVDTFRGVFGVSQFLDNEIFSNLETLVVQMNIKEVLLLVSAGPGTSAALMKKFTMYLSQWDIRVTESKNPPSYSEDLMKKNLEAILFDKSSLVLLKEVDSLRCLYCSVVHLELLREVKNSGRFYLVEYNLSQYMRLDSTALKALNIIPGVSEKQGDRISLFSLLNRCRTASGTRMLNQWLRQPLLDCQEINTRLDIVGIFSSNTKVLEELRTHYLGKFPDLLRLCKKFEMGRGNLQDIVKCYQVILMIPRIHKLLILLDSPVIMTKFLSQLQSLHVELGKFSELVEATVDLKATQRHEYIIKATFDDELAVLQSKKEKIYTAEILPVFNDACKNLRLEAHKKVKLEHSDIYGYYIRISRNDARVLDPWKDTYIELCTQKNGIYLTTDSMQHASASYARLTAEYSDKQGLLVKEIIRVASSFSPLLSLFNILISELDVLSSFAELVNTSGRRYCRPLLDASPEASLYLKAARHPTVELQDQMEFIPNDCVFSRDSESGAEMSQGEFNLDSTPLLEPCSFQIITGPNMGGKSTYIRQVGMISLMAQIGCFVPCESAQLPIFDACFARVGASDCQLKGISTFMAEMVEMASILKSATRKSLIIIDELGRGTSSADGYALALAISESIIEKLCGYTLFATHFHELSKLATEYPGKVKNYTVSTCIAASEDLVMLYKVVPGIGDQSFGLHVAKLVGFPKPLITIAKLKALELQKAEIPQFDADFEALIEYGEEILLEHGSENVSGNGQSIEALISSNHKIHELNEKLNTIFS